jgi:CheY-like chemotaxis protein/HPt (histidine-containing phosphotransfer) domain-containing protein
MERVGFAAYLRKPVRRSQLYDCLVTVLARAQQAGRADSRSIITRFTLSEQRKRGMRILVVEDNPVNQKVALTMLDRLGFGGEAVSTGAEAVELLSRQRYDLVFMDIQMPGMDGFEATAIIRDPDSAVLDHDTPIITMTAHAMQGDRERCLKAGMDGYVSKPIQPGELQQAIEQVLAARGDRQGAAETPPPPSPPPSGDKTAEAETDKPETAAAKEPQGLDLDELRAKFGDSLGVLASIVLEEAPEQLAVLEADLERGDAKALGIDAHGIKGMVGNFGVGGPFQTALELEKLGKAGDMETAAQALARLKEEMDVLCRQLEELAE